MTVTVKADKGLKFYEFPKGQKSETAMTHKNKT